MSQQWSAGSLIAQEARATGDYRGLSLQGAYKNAREMADGADTAMKGAVGLAGVAMIGLVGAAALASGGLLAPAACAVAMQALLGTSIGSLAMAGVAKLWKGAEESKASRLGPVVARLEKGAGVQQAIDFALGDKLAAKLGGWRESRSPAPSATPSSPSKKPGA